jgi:hypothetical protein
MNNPVAWISDPVRKRVFIVALVWTLVLMAISQVINAPLRTPAAPASIVSFELARTPANAQAMVGSWDARAQLFAALGLGFDYLFMPSYAFAIALACLLAAGRHKGWFAALGAWLGWGVCLGAIFDAIENIGLWHSLFGSANIPWTAVSFWCAIYKFALLLMGIAYGLTGWILPKKKW